MTQTSSAANSRRAAGVLATAAALVALVAACTSDPASTDTTAPAGTSPTATTTAAKSSPSPTRTGPNDPAGLRACQLVDALLKQPEVRDPAKVGAIADAAAESASPDVRIRGALLKQRAAIAEAARGASDEISTALNLRTAGLEMLSACIKAGFPVGGP